MLFGVHRRRCTSSCLFLNGLALGMVFGLVLGFLEGRRNTEALAAGLCASFILADGVTKSVGDLATGRGVTRAVDAGAAGLIFLPPLLVFVWMLTRIPPPDPDDVALRSERRPWTAHDGGCSARTAWAGRDRCAYFWSRSRGASGPTSPRRSGAALGMTRSLRHSRIPRSSSHWECSSPTA